MFPLSVSNDCKYAGQEKILSSELHDGIKDGTSFKYGYIKGVGTGLANYIEV